MSRGCVLQHLFGGLSFVVGQRDQKGLTSLQLQRPLVVLPVSLRISGRRWFVSFGMPTPAIFLFSSELSGFLTERFRSLHGVFSMVSDEGF